MILMTDGTPYIRLAWTGGNVPPKGFSEIHYIELVCLFYCEQVKDFTDYWKEPPSLDVAGIFWCRAKADAWRTWTNGCLMKLE